MSRRALALAHTPLLSRAGLERAAWLRTDAAALRDGWARALVLRMDDTNQVPINNGVLRLVPGPSIADAPPRDAVLIAVLDDTAASHIWAVRDPTPSGNLTDLRSTGALLGARDAGLCTTAQAVLNWHRHARFCPRCGGATEAVQAGWARRCLACGREDYPRTDPAAICLIHDGADHVLLGRQPVWPQGRYSLLAGFVEAGESAEACVVREVREEIGVTVTDVHYLGSQPWPFPRSLMLGFHARADRAAPVVPDQDEIEDARWFHRDDVRAALTADDDWTTTRPGLPFTAPGSISIARGILQSWAQHE
ncbi:NAD(+) diphosphatase [Hoyosella sp. G463]|uniref:NAD(+) diphosphatase n=1 Tax=Lolliginicoccus lacisalsi TaxID=2742202 RepID=A0A927PMQ1_9ACTN|nr:NAD(+) diphosphatase [Lolliginicoccus lacisalsi]MBD8506661.1 NAD(+) diphosphatase [Lolliginicoccus lacisalsi]